jgi:REP element-mobilizing transposase RayT
MARKPRLHVPGGLYHVILRGNARQEIFSAAADRLRFYELLADGVARFGYRVHAFCLMTNHVHLALQAGETPLSAGMQNLGLRYTQYLNARLRRVGHVFQGRFKAFLVDQDAYGLALVRYLHLNPVRAGMVREPAAYRWSSHRAYLGREGLAWLSTDCVLGQFGETAGVARRRYARFIEEGRGEGHNEAFYGGKADPRVVGEEDFVRKVLKPARTPRPPRLFAIVAHVRKAYGLTEEALLAEGRGRHPAEARALIAWLAVRTKASSLANLSDYFGRDVSTLSHALSRLEERSRNSASFASALTDHLYAIRQA